jgi:hypothetical protein
MQGSDSLSQWGMNHTRWLCTILTIWGLKMRSELKTRQSRAWKVTGLSFTFINFSLTHFTSMLNILHALPLLPDNIYVKGIEKREYFRSLQSANWLFFLSPTLLPHKNNNTLMHRFRCGAICIFINYSGARGCWASPCVHYFSRQQTGTPRNLNRRTRAINHPPAA